MKELGGSRGQEVQGGGCKAREEVRILLVGDR